MCIFKKRNQEGSTPEEVCIKYLRESLDKANEKIAALENTKSENINVAKKHIALWVYFVSVEMSVDVDEILTDVKGMIDTMRGRVKYDM